MQTAYTVLILLMLVGFFRLVARLIPLPLTPSQASLLPQVRRLAQILWERIHLRRRWVRRQ
jgi:hypothetical protein